MPSVHLNHAKTKGVLCGCNRERGLQLEWQSRRGSCYWSSAAATGVSRSWQGSSVSAATTGSIAGSAATGSRQGSNAATRSIAGSAATGALYQLQDRGQRRRPRGSVAGIGGRQDRWGSGAPTSSSSGSRGVAHHHHHNQPAAEADQRGDQRGGGGWQRTRSSVRGGGPRRGRRRSCLWAGSAAAQDLLLETTGCGGWPWRRGRREEEEEGRRWGLCFQSFESRRTKMQKNQCTVPTTRISGRREYYGRTLLPGGTEYRATGRGFVVFHAKFAENYRLYSRSHFVKGIELMILLVVYEIFGQMYRGAITYIFITVSMWCMVGTWPFAPFLFNPSGFEWQKIVDDWTDWNKWIGNHGGIGVVWRQRKAGDHGGTKSRGLFGTLGRVALLLEVLLALCFFIYQYGLVYHLNITKQYNQSVLVYGFSWVVILVMLLVMKTVSVRRRFSVEFQLVFRLIKELIFVTFISILVILRAITHMKVFDIFVCILAFMPTGACF